MKNIFFLLSGAVILFVLFTGQDMPERWSIDPHSSVKGFYEPLPGSYTDSYIPPQNAPQTVYANGQVLIVNPNFRVHPAPGHHQNEIILVRNQQLPNLLFGSANTTAGSLFSQGDYVSTDGGINWWGRDTLEPTQIPGGSGYFSDPGPAIDHNGRIVFTTLLVGGSAASMVSCWSTNAGRTFSPLVTITSQSSDKNFATADDDPTSPYYGRVYATWSNFALSAPPVVFSFTTTGGLSWSPMQQINTPPGGHYSQGVDIRTGPGGVVYICWAAPLQSGGYIEDFAGFAKSTNGGANWTVTENAYDMNGIRGTLFSPALRVNGFPRIDVDRSGGPRNGWIYIVAAEKNLAPAGSDPDVVMHRSSDNGATWSTGIRVNQDPINNGKYQWFPAVRVDEYGGLNIVYYDQRNCPSDSAEVYVSRSLDGGNTWTDILVSDHRWKPKPEPGAGTYGGDYIGITSTNNKVYPFWFDDVTGSFQAWTTTIDLGPSINHNPLPNTENTAGPYQVNAVITPAGAPLLTQYTKLHWSRNSSTITDSLLLTNTGGNNWTANIPGNNTAATYRYYLRTIDNMGRVATSPPGAPGTLHMFTAGPDNVKPIITHTALGNVPLTGWPPTVTANVVDPADFGGLDSVWVKWYKNNTTNGIIHLKLTSTGGNNFSAAFNQPSSYVTYNDMIYYKIFAQDNSSNHNRDSTALYSFQIVSQVTACVGTGTTNTAWPFNTFWHDSRTQMLYTASELTAAGAGAGSIFQVGFNVTSAASQTMNGFNVRFQNTTLSSITGWVTTGWTTSYTGTYTVPGTGLQYITLQNGFNWNGTDNLLMEICFDNTSYTSATNVASTAASNMAREYHTDGSAGCTMTSGSSVARPNTCFKINTLVGIPNSNIELPKQFTLSQNYPNPFNPTTTISYSIPKANTVVFTVYDITGKEVAKLVNEYKQAGNYNVKFDASHLASGMYLYRIESGDFVDTKKMVLVK
jgi:hypothetical protein